MFPRPDELLHDDGGVDHHHRSIDMDDLEGRDPCGPPDTSREPARPDSQPANVAAVTAARPAAPALTET